MTITYGTFTRNKNCDCNDPHPVLYVDSYVTIGSQDVSEQTPPMFKIRHLVDIDAWVVISGHANYANDMLIVFSRVFREESPIVNDSVSFKSALIAAANAAKDNLMKNAPEPQDRRFLSLTMGIRGTLQLISISNNPKESALVTTHDPIFNTSTRSELTHIRNITRGTQYEMTLDELVALEVRRNKVGAFPVWKVTCSSMKDKCAKSHIECITGVDEEGDPIYLDIDVLDRILEDYEDSYVIRSALEV